jgi:hypothetical protein
MRLPIHVTSTISRASYGHGFYEPFVQGHHLEKDKYWNGLESRWEATNQIRWYLTKVSVASTPLQTRVILISSTGGECVHERVGLA